MTVVFEGPGPAMAKESVRAAVFLNHESCWKKSNFCVDRSDVCEYRYTCNGPWLEPASSAHSFVLIPSPAGRAPVGRTLY